MILIIQHQLGRPAMDVVPLSRRGAELAGFSELSDIDLATTEPGT
jgi:hypothetical protein